MVEGFTDQVAVALAMPARDDDLCAGAKAQCQHEQHKIKHATQSRRAQLHLAHTAQKRGVGDVDQVLCHTTQNDRVSDGPNTLIADVDFHDGEIGCKGRFS